jgi:hypothetical protein
MSDISKSDVKNGLSPRFHTKIHLCEPNSRPDATAFSNEEPSVAAPKANGSMANPPNHLSSASGRSPIAIVAPKSVQN